MHHRIYASQISNVDLLINIINKIKEGDQIYRSFFFLFDKLKYIKVKTIE